MIVKPQPITVTITTGRRVELFAIMMTGLFAQCKDLHLVERWIVCDDGSTDAELEWMKQEYPFLEIHRNPGSGQASSLNFLFSKVETEWFLHLEDDWGFLKSGNLIGMLFEIANESPKYRNITLRKWEPLRPTNHLKETASGLAYVEHCFKRGEDMPTVLLTDSDWYGFSLNPALNHTETIKGMGEFRADLPATSRMWDRAQANRWHKAGFKRAGVYDEYIVHTGGDESLYNIRRRECQAASNCDMFPRECEHCAN
jgi:glycosyltransferase involved in cell wall biosynthesis